MNSQNDTLLPDYFTENLPVRTRNFFTNTNIKTCQELLDLTYNKMNLYRNAGKKTWQDIEYLQNEIRCFLPDIGTGNQSTDAQIIENSPNELVSPDTLLPDYLTEKSLVRTQHFLQNSKIKTCRELLDLTYDKMSKHRNAGKKTWQDIVKFQTEVRRFMRVDEVPEFHSQLEVFPCSYSSFDDFLSAFSNCSNNLTTAN